MCVSSNVYLSISIPPKVFQKHFLCHTVVHGTMESTAGQFIIFCKGFNGIFPVFPFPFRKKEFRKTVGIDIVIGNKRFTDSFQISVNDNQVGIKPVPHKRESFNKRHKYRQYIADRRLSFKHIRGNTGKSFYAFFYRSFALTRVWKVSRISPLTTRSAAISVMSEYIPVVSISMTVYVPRAAARTLSRAFTSWPVYL